MGRVSQVVLFEFPRSSLMSLLKAWAVSWIQLSLLAVKALPELETARKYLF